MHALLRIGAKDVEAAMGRYARGGSADQPGAVPGAVHAGYGIPHGDYDGPGQAEGSVPLRGRAGWGRNRGRPAEGGAGEIRRRGTGSQFEAAPAGLLNGHIPAPTSVPSFSPYPWRAL